MSPRPLLDASLGIMAALFGGLFLAPLLGFQSPGWGRPTGEPMLIASTAALATLLAIQCFRLLAARRQTDGK